MRREAAARTARGGLAGGRRGSARPQRGVALITAVLIVALATILAVSVGFKGYLDQRRTATAFALDQAFEVALGGEAWASDVLRRDAQQSANTDDFTEEWATPIPPIPLEDGSGEFEGVLEDMQGRFNLNSVVVVQGGKFVRNDIAYERFKRLLELLQLEPKWADMLVDWIDSDANEGFPSGAEDSAYTSLTPAHRAANMPVTRTSELLALQDFGMERYRRLEPFISALPIDTQLNLCTAPAEVLDSIVEGQTEYTLGRENMIDLRKQRCFPTLTDFAPVLSRMPADQRDALTSTLTQKSAYFRATIWVTIGTTRYTLYSLLYRPSGANLVRPILRSSGTL